MAWGRGAYHGKRKGVVPLTEKSKAAFRPAFTAGSCGGMTVAGGIAAGTAGAAGGRPRLVPQAEAAPAGPAPAASLQAGQTVSAPFLP